MDPFGAQVQDGELWGRGSFDMKGQAVAQILAFLRLKRDRVPLARDVILLAEPDEEVGGALGARWMIANHYGIFPAAITAETAGSMHGDAEHVRLASIVEASEARFDAIRETLAR